MGIADFGAILARVGFLEQEAVGDRCRIENFCDRAILARVGFLDQEAVGDR